jgi:hypothetical protein
MVQFFHLVLVFLGFLTITHCEIKEYTLEEWLSEQNESPISLSGSQGKQELPSQKVSNSQEELTNDGTHNETIGKSSQAQGGEEFTGTEGQTINLDTVKNKTEGEENNSDGTTNKNDKNIEKKSNRNSNNKVTSEAHNSVNIDHTENSGHSDVSTSDQKKKKVHSDNQEGSNTKHSSSGTKLGGKYAEFRSRGGSGGSGSSEPCVEDNTVRAVQIKSVLMEVSDRFDLNDSESPQYQAAAWIIYGDPMRLSANDPRLFQRYSAVVLYLATKGDKWYVCSANTTSPCGRNAGSDMNNASLSYYYSDGYTDDNAAESKSKRELNKVKARSEERWLSDTSECEWYGLHCDSEGYVTSIDLNENNLSGELPPEIKTFCKARDIKMAGNKICGRLPNSFGELNLLKNLRLGRNLFTGLIPSTLFQLALLERLDIHANMFSGRISTKMGNLKELRRLQLSQNLFTGTIPKQIGELGKLSESTMT